MEHCILDATLGVLSREEQARFSYKWFHTTSFTEVIKYIYKMLQVKPALPKTREYFFVSRYK